MASRKTESPPLSLFSFQDIITSVTGILILVTLILAVDLTTRKKTASTTRTTERVSTLVTKDIEEIRAEIESLTAFLSDENAIINRLAAASESSVMREMSDLQSQIEALQKESQQLTKQRDRELKAQTQAAQQLSARQQELVNIETSQLEAESLEKKRQQLANSKSIVFRASSKSGKRAWLVDVGSEKLIVARADDQHQQVPITGKSADQLSKAFIHWATRQCHRETDYFVLLVRPQGILVHDRLVRDLQRKGFQFGFDLLDKQQTFLPDPADSP